MVAWDDDSFTIFGVLELFFKGFFRLFVLGRVLFSVPFILLFGSGWTLLTRFMALAIFLILLFGTWSVKYNLEDLDVGDYEKVHRCRDFVALFTGVKPKFVSHDLPPSSWVRWILPLKNSQIFFERIGNKGEIIHHPDAGGPKYASLTSDTQALLASTAAWGAWKLEWEVRSVLEKPIKHFWVVGSNNYYFHHVHPYLGKWSQLTNIFQMGWNHQLDLIYPPWS